MNNWLRRR